MSNGTNFVLDLSNYKDRVGARVEPGRYRVVVDDAEMDKSKAGNPMINVWLRIVGGEFDGATITDRLTLTEKALFRVVGFMQAIGLPTPKKRLQVDLRHFFGKTLDVDVEDGDPYNGRIKSEVRGYIRVTKGAKADDADGLDVPEDLPEEEPEETTEEEVEETAAEETAEEPTPITKKAPAKKAAAAPEPVAEGFEDVDLDTLDLG